MTSWLQSSIRGHATTHDDGVTWRSRKEGPQVGQVATNGFEVDADATTRDGMNGRLVAFSELRRHPLPMRWVDTVQGDALTPSLPLELPASRLVVIHDSARHDFSDEHLRHRRTSCHERLEDKKGLL